MLPLVAAAALAALLLALAVAASPLAPAAGATHIALAAGVLPLILGAFVHFVPVLTRSGEPSRGVAALPWLAWAGGLATTLALLDPGALRALLPAGAALALAAVIALGAWMRARSRAALGAPHPGLRWYAAALACLGVALAAALALWVRPEWHGPLRLAHLHLNLLGFVGLAALGTLQVLLPTAAGAPDPGAAARLRRDLLPALAGVLAVAAGAAFWPPLSLAGAALLAWSVAGMGLAWARRYGRSLLRLHGSAPPLVAALAGLGALLLLSAGHALGPLSGRDALLGFLAGFLPPLITGALTQLLPVWLRPGMQTDWHRRTRDGLARFGGLRGLLFLACALALSLGASNAVWIAAAVLLSFMAQALVALARR